MKLTSPQRRLLNESDWERRQIRRRHNTEPGYVSSVRATQAQSRSGELDPSFSQKIQGLVAAHPNITNDYEKIRQRSVEIYNNATDAWSRFNDRQKLKSWSDFVSKLSVRGASVLANLIKVPKGELVSNLAKFENSNLSLLDINNALNSSLFSTAQLYGLAHINFIPISPLPSLNDYLKIMEPSIGFRAGPNRRRVNGLVWLILFGVPEARKLITNEGDGYLKVDWENI